MKEIEMMDEFSPCSFTRRGFLSATTALAGAGCCGLPTQVRAEPPPEITTIRLEDFPAICLARQYLAEELRYAEGFTKVSYMADQGHEPRYELSLDVLKSLPYDRWRQADPEDTIRFHALRLYEVGMIKTPPNKLISQRTDWRFLNELKKELKA
jgi:hypothetical protein